jgi:hypothetical protein
MTPRRATIILALAAAGATLAPQAAGAASRPDFHDLGPCAPDVTKIELTPGGEAYFAFTVPTDCAPQTWDLYFEDLRANGGKDLPADGRIEIGRATVALPYRDTDTGDTVGAWEQLMPWIGQAPCGAQLDLVLRGDASPYAAAVVEAASCAPPPVTADCADDQLPRFTVQAEVPGRLRLELDTPAGPAVYDRLVEGPGPWTVIPGVGAAEHTLTVTQATVTDDAGNVHPAEVTGGDCYTAPALPPVPDVTPPPSAATGDVPPGSQPPAPGAGTPASGGDERTTDSLRPAAATPVVLDTTRASLPVTGGRHLGLQALAALILGVPGAVMTACAWAMRRNERAEVEA